MPGRWLAGSDPKEAGQGSGRKGLKREKKRKKKKKRKIREKKKRREKEKFSSFQNSNIYPFQIFETSFRFDVFFTIISILNEYGTKSNFQAIIEY